MPAILSLPEIDPESISYKPEAILLELPATILSYKPGKEVIVVGVVCLGEIHLVVSRSRL